MRYAFYMEDIDARQKLVAKVPKDLNPKNYNLESMKSDIEAMIICQHIVNEFNDLMIEFQDESLLTEFVRSYIYEFPAGKSTKYQLMHAENFIQGKYEKFNNNAGWKTNQSSKESMIA